MGENELAQGWFNHGSIYFKTYGTVTQRQKVAAFDLDGTIIKPKQGTSCKAVDDWVMYPSKEIVKKRFLSLVENRHEIVIFTNQMGIEKELTTAAIVTERIDKVQSEIDIPLRVFVMASDDEFRKPRPFAWFLYTKLFNESANIHESFYVGDAGGRIYAERKDFADTDRKFALNIGLRFLTPEQYFLEDKSKVKYETFKFDPRNIKIVKDENIAAEEPKTQELVILVGPPASGKSHMCRIRFPTYERINQDTVESESKCLQAAEKALTEGKSCIIDSQNHTIVSRSDYIKIAKKMNVKCRALVLMVPKHLSMHLNEYRMINKKSKEHRSMKVPRSTIHSYYRDYSFPKKNEGIDEIDTMDFGEKIFLGPFESRKEEELAKMFLH